jgi:hypothetical protein
MSHKNVIVDLDTALGNIVVQKQENGEFYDVFVDNEKRHPNCTSEDVMRALSQYTYAIQHKLDKFVY